MDAPQYLGVQVTATHNMPWFPCGKQCLFCAVAGRTLELAAAPDDRTLKIR